MHPEPIVAFAPIAMIGHSVPAETEERPSEAEAEETELPAVGVTREHEIRLASGQIVKLPRIVEHHDAGDSRNTRVVLAHLREVRLSVPPHEIGAHDLHLPRRCIDHPRVAEEELDAVLGHGIRDRLRRLVIVIAVTGKNAPGQLLQRGEGVGEEALVGVRLHGQKVAREEDEVRILVDRALANLGESLHRHERANVGVRDLHDAKRLLHPPLTPWLARDDGHVVVRGAPIGERKIDGLALGGERLEHANRGERIGQPRCRGVEAEGERDAPGEREQGARGEERSRPAHEEAIRQRPHARAREGEEIHVHRDMEERDDRQHHRVDRGHLHREQRVNADEHAYEHGEGAAPSPRRGDGDHESTHREPQKPGHREPPPSLRRRERERRLHRVVTPTRYVVAARGGGKPT